MVRKFVKILLCFLAAFVFKTQAQDSGVKSPKYSDYKSDTSFKDFSDLRYKVAKAQINALKNGGALLVRLKTNAKTIAKLKAAGNNDLATQVESETFLANKIMMTSYWLECKFCPVYFFFSEQSDSVRQKKLDGIFVDTTLNVNSSIVCKAPFYLVAEPDFVYNSSLGIVSESQAQSAEERGNRIREARIVVKNRYFIQLHKPFPYFQLKGSYESPVSGGAVGNSIYFLWLNSNSQYAKINKIPGESKKMRKFRETVGTFNQRLEKFYEDNAGYAITPEISEFVY